MRAALLALLLVGCVPARPEPEFLESTECTAKASRDVQVCNSDATGNALGGAILGGLFFGKKGAIAGSIIGASNSTQRCHTQQEEYCTKTEQVRRANPNFKREAK